MVAIIINEFLKVSVKSSGAELISIKNTISNTEYLWQGDPSFWGRRAPVLFPIVGKVSGNKYRVDGKEYELPQHGFARDMHFDLVDQQDSNLTYCLKSSEQTKKLYPYDFELYISYSLNGNKLIVSYEVKNTDDKAIYFSIGAHPGFRCPLEEKESFNDYYLEFEKKENAVRHLITEGLANGKTEEVLKDENILNLSYDLFNTKDAVIFKNLKSSQVTLKSRKSKHQIKMDFAGFPYLGIWTKPGPFVCLEPWFGIADQYGYEGEFKDKEAIRSLMKGKTFKAEYSIEIK
ncbi:MAG: aldose 1-epimerase family protein [Cytophagaceae bacterium]